MAGIALSGWPSGATVSAYVAPSSPSMTPDTDALGAAVTSGVASGAGQVVLSGLTPGVRYIASDGVSRRRFLVPASAVTVKDNGQAGFVPVPPAATASSVAVAANRGYAVRFVLDRAAVITSIAFAVSTASALDDAFDVGLYDAAMARVSSSGSKQAGSPGVTGGGLNTTGVKSVALPAPVVWSPGVVGYAAFAAGAAGASVGSLAAGGVLNAKLFGATAGLVEMEVKDAMFPLPASWGALALVSSIGVLLALRES